MKSIETHARTFLPLNTSAVGSVTSDQMTLPLNYLPYFGQRSTLAIIVGVIGAIIHSILIFGAQTRNSTAINVWMVLACLAAFGYGWLSGDITSAIAKSGSVLGALVYFWLFILIGIIFLLIWTCHVAKKAKKEIVAGEF